MKTYRSPSVLSIAGFDGSGGAGQQADVKTISALGCYATCVLTGLPIQNTLGVQKIYSIPLEAVKDQIKAVMDDILPDVIKIGMVNSVDLAQVIADCLKSYPAIPVVFDPVMVASSGDLLMKEKEINEIIEVLFPLTDLVTPNMYEAEVLSNMKVETIEDMRRAGAKILRLDCEAVLLKGGHQKGKTLHSYLIDKAGKQQVFKSPKIETRNTHGSGCTLSSAIASYWARGESLYRATTLAQDYVFNAINQAKDVCVGKGTGPLNHFFDPQKMIKI